MKEHPLIVQAWNLFELFRSVEYHICVIRDAPIADRDYIHHLKRRAYDRYLRRSVRFG